MAARRWMNLNSNMFQLVAPFQPAGDQPQAIEKLVAGLRKAKKSRS